MTPFCPPLRRIAPIVASLVVLAACSDDDGGASTPEGIELSTTTTTSTTVPETRTQETTTTEASPPDTSDTAPGTQDPATDVLVPRVGTWVVGDAGEIDVDLTADGLVLLDVRAAPGWQVSVDEQAPDELEVDFEQGDVEWEIEIEWENGILEIEIDQDVEPAEPGVVVVGVAGSVEFDVGPDGLVLADVTTADGWEAAVTGESPDELEVLFVNGLAEYDVEIELDDGVIEVEVDFEVEGPFAP